jgi:hypothetical protein
VISELQSPGGFYISAGEYPVTLLRQERKKKRLSLIHKMASPILSQRTYRLSHIPTGTATDEIRELFPPRVREAIQYLSLAQSPSSTARNSQVATVTFEAEPALLETLPSKFGTGLSTLLDSFPEKLSQVWVDAHFLGFTTLNNPSNQQDVVEYVEC